MKHPLTLLTALLLAPLAALSAAESLPNRPLLLANYYCWYHDGQHPKRPFQHWITWEKPVLIEAARLVSGHHQEGVHTGPLTDFTLQWHDGSGWKDIPGCAVTGNQLLAWAVRFTAVTTTRVRLVITATPDGISRIWEVELYAPSQIPSR
ncbi:MAG: hypothetical protein MUE50_22220 [Pirellulaceae bacterium]|nr:hypothetical protein [Pirellulaceae bacterium]